MRAKWLLMLLMAGLPAGRAAAADKPNILFIVVETLRRDHVGCYGYRRATTPTLDRMASEGARFDQAIGTASWTIPTVMSMFTSLPPEVHGVVSHACCLADGATTLAAELRRAGYQTAGITSTPSTNGKFGFDRGFEFYDDYTIVLDAGLDLAGDGEPPKAISERPTGEQLTRLAVAWLSGKRDRAKPFFLHLFYFDPHYDYLPPPPYDRMFVDPGNRSAQTGRGIRQLKDRPLAPEDREKVVGLYDGEVRYTDDQIGLVLEELGAQGLMDKTVVVIGGDHGDEFWDHGGTTHGHTLYDELVRVPLLVRYPERIGAGTVVREQVSHIDVMPTVLELAGVPVPAQCMGRSLVPPLEGRTKGFGDRPAFMSTRADALLDGARTPTQKIVEAVGWGRTAMYALSEDPREKHDLSGTDRAAEFNGLRAKLDEWRKQAAVRGSQARKPRGPQLDPELIRQLRSLGYVQ